MIVIWFQVCYFIFLFLTASISFFYFVKGPFKVNGVPLRRVNQAYVIATSTKVNIDGVTVEKFDDKYFAKEVEKKKKKGEGEFFEAEKDVSTVCECKTNLLLKMMFTSQTKPCFCFEFVG